MLEKETMTYFKAITSYFYLFIVSIVSIGVLYMFQEWMEELGIYCLDPTCILFLKYICFYKLLRVYHAHICIANKTFSDASFMQCIFSNLFFSTYYIRKLTPAP